ncbi:hypothetical protein ACOI1C_22420 [Bacillus sp. DJP31]|uniref:hypothetical protein n=1 Tax=Bacillus sp. DJP31 TaxID=3409789 RepID=UPI003BB4FBAB
MNSLQETYREEYKEYLMTLFSDAWKKRPMDFIYSILRVTGIHDGHWDPYVEMLEAFEDYNKILYFSNEQGGKTPLRVGLLMYCQAIEITAVHELLANLLRGCGDKPFIINPFIELQRKSKKSAFSYIPPSANAKIKRLKVLATECGDTKFIEILDSFYDDQVRNSFVHSDYCITEEEFRWTEGGLQSPKSIEYISNLITRTFAFFEALIQVWNTWLFHFTKLPKYTKLPQYEVLEVHTNDKGLFGFSVHFSNGQRTYFERHPYSINSCNLFLEKDGSINFFVGDLSELERVWKVNGKEIDF